MTKMMNRQLSFIVSGILILVASPASGSGPGTSIFEFLNIPEGARETGLGSGTAISHNASSYWWNPAGLAYIERGCFSLSYNSWFEGITRQRAGWSFPMENRAAAAFNLTLHSVKGIDGYDWYGTPSSELSAGAYAISYTQARRFANYLAGGLTIRGLIEVLDEESAWGGGFDAGAILEPADNLWISIGVRNFGISGSFIDEKEKMPLTLFSGIGMQINRYMLLASDVIYLDGELRYGAGLEAGIWDLLFFRGGWNNHADTGEGFHAGAGWRLKDLRFDYSISPYGDLGSSHRVEISFEYGKPPLIEQLYRKGRRLYSEGRYDDAFLEFSKVRTLDADYKQVRSWLEKTGEKLK